VGRLKRVGISDLRALGGGARALRGPFPRPRLRLRADLTSSVRVREPCPESTGHRSRRLKEGPGACFAATRTSGRLFQRRPREPSKPDEPGGAVPRGRVTPGVTGWCPSPSPLSFARPPVFPVVAGLRSLPGPPAPPTRPLPSGRSLWKMGCSRSKYQVCFYQGHGGTSPDPGTLRGSVPAWYSGIESPAASAARAEPRPARCPQRNVADVRGRSRDDGMVRRRTRRGYPRQGAPRRGERNERGALDGHRRHPLRWISLSFRSTSLLRPTSHPLPERAA
jgi:hypothetical protein